MSLIQHEKFQAPQPTSMTLFLRSFTGWQIIRFIIINIRMTFMILKSHATKVKDQNKDEFIK
jgi:hypothetical protein